MPETVYTVDCGDTRKRADRGSQFRGPNANALAASVTLTPGQTGQAFTNTGSTGTVQVTLPANPADGLWFLFEMTTAQTFEVLPGAGATINGGSTKISAAGTQINLAIATVIAIGGNWFTFLKGTWTTS